MKTIIISICAALTLTSCQNGKITPQQQAIATASGLAAFNVVAQAAANGEKIDAKVAVKAGAAALDAATKAAQSPSATPAAP